MTIFAPEARHFLVHSSAPACAPFAAHLSSTTHPLTVVLFPMSSNAIADNAHTKQNARQIDSTFLMTGFSFEILLRPQTAKRRRSYPDRNSRPADCEMKLGKYTTIDDAICHTAPAGDPGVASEYPHSKTAKAGATTSYARVRNNETTSSRSDSAAQEL